MTARTVVATLATAAATFAVTVVAFWPTALTATEAQAPETPVAQPALTVDGVRVTAAAAQDQEALGIVLTAVNNGSEPCDVEVQAELLHRPPVSPMSRMMPVYAPVWTHSVAIKLAPGETKTFDLTPDKAGPGSLQLNLKSGSAVAAVWSRGQGPMADGDVFAVVGQNVNTINTSQLTQDGVAAVLSSQAINTNAPAAEGLMSRGTGILGVALGLLAAGATLALVGRERAGHVEPPAVVLTDCDGPLQELVIQYVRAAAGVSGPVYASFLPQLPEGVVVHVVCREAEDVADLRRRVGPIRCTLRPVVTGGALTTWSRDRWLASLDERGATVLRTPDLEDGQQGWPARAGDARIGEQLEAALPRVRHVRSPLLFDGGDFVVDAAGAMVAGRLVLRNVQHSVEDLPQLRAALERLLGRDFLILDAAPDHHAGMYVMAAGDGVVFVGDPAAGLALLDGAAAQFLPGGAAAVEPLQADLDAVAAQLRASGRTVRRMPVVAGADGRSWLTPLNAILDQRDGRRIVYMPVYAGADRLNAAARAAWEAAGVVVHPVDCTSAYRHFGSLRCLVNVLRRG